MKRIIAILCILAIIMTFVGCGTAEPKPEATVTTFCNAMKEFDFAKMQSCVNDTFTEGDTLNKSDDMPESFYNSMKDYAKSITYTIGTSTVEGDSAKVDVTFKYKDASAVITTALGDYMYKALALAFSGGNTSDEAMSDLFVSSFNDSLTKAEVKDAETTTTFNLIKVDSEWKIKDVSNEIVYVLTSDIVKALADWSNNDSESESSKTPEYIGDPNFVWHNVAIGETAEFATLKLKLTGCSETTELKGLFGNKKADDGTKFIVFTYTVENITKQEITFSSEDFKLYDSQERQFSAYDDAYWYNDDVLVYETLSPNMPKKGVSIFNVPKDATGYFMIGGKSGTNEYFKMYGK